MTPGETCSTCKAFAALSNECRRKSPTPVMIPTAPGKAMIKGIYPATTKDDWCREYEPVDQQQTTKTKPQWEHT